jgi:hypothetical protein
MGAAIILHQQVAPGALKVPYGLVDAITKPRASGQPAAIFYPFGHPTLFASELTFLIPFLLKTFKKL